MLSTKYLKTDFGTFKISGNDKGVVSVRLTDYVGFDDIKPSKHVVACANQMEEYFQKKRTSFDLTFDWTEGTDFYKKVWSELVKIPYGQTCSYLDVAERLGDKKAVRAVGQANRNNPIAIIVPCHRVVAKNGDLQGYFYGVDMKQRLLEFENPKQFGRQISLF